MYAFCARVCVINKYIQNIKCRGKIAERNNEKQ